MHNVFYYSNVHVSRYTVRNISIKKEFELHENL